MDRPAVELDNASILFLYPRLCPRSLLCLFLWIGSAIRGGRLPGLEVEKASHDRPWPVEFGVFLYCMSRIVPGIRMVVLIRQTSIVTNVLLKGACGGDGRTPSSTLRDHGRRNRVERVSFCGESQLKWGFSTLPPPAVCYTALSVR